MRKFIATSTCTILLSLLAASGFNQNSYNYSSELSANSNSTSIEQNVTGKEGQNLFNNYKVAAAEEVTTKVDQKGDSLIDLNKTEVKGATVTNKTAVNKCSSSDKATCKKDTKNCNTNNCNTSNKCGTKNGKSLIYKNIDLSQCKNTKEVIQKLQANGCSNITSSSIKNNKSLAGIINKIEKKSNCQGSCSSDAKKEVVTKTNQEKANTTKTNTTKTNTTKTTTKPVATNTTSTTTATKPVATNTTPTKATEPKTTATNSTATNNSSMSSFASQVLQLVNQERAKQGLSALTTNTTLTAAANVRAKETFSSFSHTRPNGTSFSTVLKEYNVSYRTAGENIAYGQKTPQEVMTGWMNSPGHRANILNSNYGKIGIGVYKANNGRIYWSQLFTN